MMSSAHHELSRPPFATTSAIVMDGCSKLRLHSRRPHPIKCFQKGLAPSLREGVKLRESLGWGAILCEQCNWLALFILVKLAFTVQVAPYLDIGENIQGVVGGGGRGSMPPILFIKNLFLDMSEHEKNRVIGTCLA